MILRVTIDTNLYISGLLYGGTPGNLLIAAAERRYIPLVSGPILEELERKLLHRFHRPPAVVNAYMQRILDIAEFVSPHVTIYAVPRDSDDNRILECAVEAQAGFVVTGDKDLLSLGIYQNIPIVTARQFLDLHITTP